MFRFKNYDHSLLRCIIDSYKFWSLGEWDWICMWEGQIIWKQGLWGPYFAGLQQGVPRGWGILPHHADPPPGKIWGNGPGIPVPHPRPEWLPEAVPTPKAGRNCGGAAHEGVPVWWQSGDEWVSDISC